jgi:hypothetical protein
MRRLCAAIPFALLLASAPLARAGPVVDRIKAAGVIRCGGAAGTYADIFARNLGERSKLQLPRGPNFLSRPSTRFRIPSDGNVPIASL